MLYSAIIGLIAGYIASKIQTGNSNGLLINLFLGICGGAVGGWLFGIFGIITYSWVGDIICGVIGAIICLWVFSKLRSK